MHSTCPNCEARLEDFQFSCDRCGWTLNQDEFTDQSAPSSEADFESQPTEVDLYLDKSRDAIEDNQFPDAVKFLNRAIVDAPEERLAECFSLRGYAHLKNGRFDMAENDCTEAIERHWQESQTYAWRAAARGEQNKWRMAFDDLNDACRLAGNQRDPYLSLMQSYISAASEYFREQIKNGNDTADMFFDRGWVYFQSANYPKAHRDFELALKLDRKHAWASLGMAKAKFASQSLGKDLLLEIIKHCEIAMAGDKACKQEAIKIRAHANQQYGHVAKASRDLKMLRQLAGKDAKLLIECGELRQELGDHVAAINDFSEAMELDPKQLFALQCRGDCYSAIRNYRLAIEDYTLFLRTFPDDLSARVKRGSVYAKSGRPDLALSDFDRVLEDDKTCCDAYLGRSKIFLRRGQLDQALTECQKAVRLDNQQPEAFETLAEIYFKLCDYGRAIEEFDRAIRLAKSPSEKAQYLYRRGTAQYETDDFTAALSDLRAATELRPNHAGTWIWKAAACSRLENWQEAILGLQKAIAIRPAVAEQYQTLGKPVANRAIEFFRQQVQRGKKSAEIYSSRGLAYQFIGEHNQAIDDYTAAIDLNPKDLETILRRGETHAQIGDHEKAILDFKKVIRYKETHHWARFCRALSRAALGEHEKALQDVVKAIRIAPRQPRYHVLHAELLQRTDTVKQKGDWSKVIKAYDRSIRIDSADASTLRRRAMAHVHSGQLLESVRDFTRALELDPRNTELLVQRGQAYLKSGQEQMALHDFELALTRDAKLAKAYSGRATILTMQNRHQYATIWLTKAIHRFGNPRDVAEIVFARGKVFFQMKRFQPAINDFHTVYDLMKKEKSNHSAAQLACGIAFVHLEDFENAQKMFERLRKAEPNNQAAAVGLHWLQDRSQPLPGFMSGPSELIRPLKPNVVAEEVDVQPNKEFDIELPYNSWVLRVEASREFGPVTKATLDTWAAEGRIDEGMKLLRADWSKWKRAEKVYGEIAARAAKKNEFPGIQIGGRSSEGDVPLIGDVPAVVESSPVGDAAPVVTSAPKIDDVPPVSKAPEQS